MDTGLGLPNGKVFREVFWLLYDKKLDGFGPRTGAEPWLLLDRIYQGFEVLRWYWS